MPRVSASFLPPIALDPGGATLMYRQLSEWLPALDHLPLGVCRGCCLGIGASRRGTSSPTVKRWAT